MIARLLDAMKNDGGFALLLDSERDPVACRVLNNIVNYIVEE